MSIIDRQGIEVYLDPKGVVSGAAIARRSLQSLTLGTRNLLAGLTGVSGALGGLAIGYGIKSAIGIMADFESTMSAVEAVTGATGESFDALSQQAQELGASTKFTASQAAEGMKFLGMAGLEVNEILSAMPDMLDLASAGTLDLGRAADIASNVMSQFGLEAKEMSRIASILAYTASSTNTNIEQLADALKYAGPVAAGLGMELDGVASALGILANSGIQASSGGTQLRRMLASLTDPTGEAKKGLKELADAAGLLPEAFNPAGKTIDELMNNLALAREAIGEFAFVQKTFNIFGNIPAPSVLALSKYNKELEKQIEDVNKADDAHKKMARTMEDNLVGAWTSVKSAIESIIIGTGQEGSVTDILKDAGFELANWIRTLDDAGGPLDNIGEKLKGILETTVETAKNAKEWAETLAGAAVGAKTGKAIAGPAGAVPGAVIGGTLPTIARELGKYAAETNLRNFPVQQAPGTMPQGPTLWTKHGDNIAAVAKETGRIFKDDFFVPLGREIQKPAEWINTVFADMPTASAGSDYIDASLDDASSVLADILNSHNDAIEENAKEFGRLTTMIGPMSDALSVTRGKEISTVIAREIVRDSKNRQYDFPQGNLGIGYQSPANFGKVQGVDPTGALGLGSGIMGRDALATSDEYLKALEDRHVAINNLIEEGNAILADRPPTLDQLRERETQILGALKQQGDVNEDNKANVEALNALLSDTRLQIESVNSQGSQFADLLEEATNLQESQIPTLDELVSKYDLINAAITEARETHGENSEEVKALNLLLSETREKIDAAKIASDGFANTWEHIKQGVDAYQDALSGLDDVPFKISQMLENVEDEITVQILMDKNVDMSSLWMTIREQIKKLAIEKMISEPIVRGLGEVVQQIGGAVMKSPIGDMIGGALGKLGGVGGVAGDIIGAMIGAEKPENYEPITASIDTLGGINQAGFDKVAAAIGDAKIAEASKPQFEKDKTIPGQITKDQIFKAAGIEDAVFQAKGVTAGKNDPKSIPLEKVIKEQFEQIFTPSQVGYDPSAPKAIYEDGERLIDVESIIGAIDSSTESTNAATQAQTGMLGSIFNSVGGALGGVFNSVGGMLGGVFSGVGGSILGGLGGLGGSIIGGLGGLGGLIGSGLSGLGGLLGSGFSGLSGVLSSGFGGLGGILSSGFGAMVGALGAVVALKEVFQDMTSFETGDKFKAMSKTQQSNVMAQTAKYQSQLSSPSLTTGFNKSNDLMGSSNLIYGKKGLAFHKAVYGFSNGGYSDNGVYSSNIQSGQISSVNSFANGGYSDNGVYSSPITKTDVAHYNNMQYGSYARGGYSDNSVYSVNGFNDASKFADGGYTGRDNGPLPGGGIPTITHPNEAIVPLPDGRNIPVEIVNNNQANNARSVNVTINVRNSSDIMRDSVRIKRMLGEVMA
jgi:TP901 family phage tail tape measure protein